MSTDSSNRTYNLTGNEFPRPPRSHCLTWITVLSTECLAIVIVNIITIIVFLRQHQLRRRSLYLIIHLAIVDLLVGGISCSLRIEIVGAICALWEYSSSNSWDFWTKLALTNAFPFVSFINLTALSLERLHATFRPLKHRFLKKRIYYVTITVIWLLVVIMGSGQTVAIVKQLRNFALLNYSTYLVVWLICLVIICVSYIAIYIKIRFSRQPIFFQNSVTNRERQLTSTLFIAVVTSLLTSLPWAIFMSLPIFNYKLITYLSFTLYFHMLNAVLMLLLASSLANPIIYAIRMPEVKAGLAVIFHRTSQKCKRDRCATTPYLAPDNQAARK